MSQRNEPNEILAGCSLMLLTFPFLAVLHAITIQYGWNSLMVPIFGLKALNAYQAYGLSLIATLLVASDQNKGAHDAFKGMNDIWEIFWTYIGRAFGRPVLFLVFTWLTVWISGDKLIQ